MPSIAYFLAVFGMSLVLGLGSAWYMIEEGSALTTRYIGPWSVWRAAGKPDADPYTKAHMARTGHLPITSTSALYYFAETDQSGARLRSRCEYTIDGQPLNAAWWSLALYDGSGRLIPNKANRHAFNRGDIIRRSDGSFRIVLAQKARPGNWLPTPEEGSLKLILRVYGPRESDPLAKGRNLEENLPVVRKASCE